MGARQSPLFAPVIWEGDHFRILDETLLPWEVEYLTVRETSGALRAVKEMKTRAFGQVLTFLYTALLETQRQKDRKPEAIVGRLNQLAEDFTQTRPTFDFKGLARTLHESFGESPTTEDQSWIEAKILGFAARIMQARENRSRRAARLLPNPCRLLTHCNISGEIVTLARFCGEMGKELRVIATETRPYLQGSRLTAWELAQAGIPVSLIPDGAVAQVMAGGEVDAVVVGSDRCAQNGDIVNKVGTYPLALVARKYHIPFSVFVQRPGAAASGDDITIEERPVSELLTFRGRSYAPEGLQGVYPAFDVTPAALISHLIGFDETLTPEDFRKRFLKASATCAAGAAPKRRFVLLYGVPTPEDYAPFSQILQAEQAEAVLIPEMRPELWGVHVMARELLERNIPAVLISDNMMGTFFAKGEIRRLYLFYTELTANGPVGNCGSLLAALLARAHQVPIELLGSKTAPQSTLDRDVATFLGERVAPEAVAIHPIKKNELIPWSLFQESETATDEKART